MKRGQLRTRRGQRVRADGGDRNGNVLEILGPLLRGHNDFFEFGIFPSVATRLSIYGTGTRDRPAGANKKRCSYVHSSPY